MNSAVEGLAASGPLWIFTLAVLCLLVFLVVKVYPGNKELRDKQLDIEREREKRKADEARMRNERERENAAITQRQLDVLDQNTIVLKGLQTEMSTLIGMLDVSHEGSARMGKQVDEMGRQVDGIEVKVDRIGNQVSDIHHEVMHHGR